VGPRREIPMKSFDYDVLFVGSRFGGSVSSVLW
jgi:hypothetical protein